MEWDGRRQAAVISTWKPADLSPFLFLSFFIFLSLPRRVFLSSLFFPLLFFFLTFCVSFSLAFYFLVLLRLSLQLHRSPLSLSLLGAVHAKLTTREAAQYISEIIRLLGSCAFTLIHPLAVCLVTASLHTGITTGPYAVLRFGIIAVE